MVDIVLQVYIRALFFSVNDKRRSVNWLQKNCLRFTILHDIGHNCSYTPWRWISLLASLLTAIGVQSDKTTLQFPFVVRSSYDLSRFISFL